MFVSSQNRTKLNLSQLNLTQIGVKYINLGTTIWYTIVLHSHNVNELNKCKPFVVLFSFLFVFNYCLGISLSRIYPSTLTNVHFVEEVWVF